MVRASFPTTLRCGSSKMAQQIIILRGNKSPRGDAKTRSGSPRRQIAKNDIVNNALRQLGVEIPRLEWGIRSFRKERGEAIATANMVKRGEVAYGHLRTISASEEATGNSDGPKNQSRESPTGA